MAHSTNALVGFLISHNCKAWIANGMIFAVDSWTRQGSNVWVDEIVILPHDLQAIRTFLGY